MTTFTDTTTAFSIGGFVIVGLLALGLPAEHVLRWAASGAVSGAIVGAAGWAAARLWEEE